MPAPDAGGQPSRPVGPLRRRAIGASPTRGRISSRTGNRFRTVAMTSARVRICRRAVLEVDPAGVGRGGVTTLDYGRGQQQQGEPDDRHRALDELEHGEVAAPESIGAPFGVERGRIGSVGFRGSSTWVSAGVRGSVLDAAFQIAEEELRAEHGQEQPVPTDGPEAQDARAVAPNRASADRKADAALEYGAWRGHSIPSSPRPVLSRVEPFSDPYTGSESAARYAPGATSAMGQGIGGHQDLEAQVRGGTIPDRLASGRVSAPHGRGATASPRPARERMTHRTQIGRRRHRIGTARTDAETGEPDRVLVPLPPGSHPGCVGAS